MSDLTANKENEVGRNTKAVFRHLLQVLYSH